MPQLNTSNWSSMISFYLMLFVSGMLNIKVIHDKHVCNSFLNDIFANPKISENLQTTFHFLKIGHQQ